MNKPPSLWHLYHEGAKFGWEFHISNEDMQNFAKLSGDDNPVHNDLQFAKDKGFQGPVIYGLLLAGQVSRLIGEELPDQHAMLTFFSSNFLRPALMKEKLRFDAELVTKSNSTHAICLKFKISSNRSTLCRGTVEAVWRG